MVFTRLPELRLGADANELIVVVVPSVPTPVSRPSISRTCPAAASQSVELGWPYKILHVVSSSTRKVARLNSFAGLLLSSDHEMAKDETRGLKKRRKMVEV